MGFTPGLQALSFKLNQKGVYIMQTKEDKKSRNIEKEKTQTSKKEGAKPTLNQRLELSLNKYNQAYTMMSDAGIRLYILRLRTKDLIHNIEYLVNSIANHPKSFDSDIGDIKIFKNEFTKACELVEQELHTARLTGLTAVAGLSAGASVAIIAPSAAMWVATTFGTASTGTAISSLSGAVATNAALAWLGGGAISAGGGGLAAGKALLALAGPVGWGLAGVTILGSISIFSYKKIRLHGDKKNEIKSIIRNTQQVSESEEKIKLLIRETDLLFDNLTTIYENALIDFGKDFNDIPQTRQLQLGTLVNTTKAIAYLLNKTI